MRDGSRLLATLLAGFADDGWREQALCAEVDPDVWFPETGGGWQVAKKICGRCQVRAQCLDWALTSGEEFGVWGGQTARERRARSQAA